MDKKNGDLSGAYRYDPFGRLISVDGDVARGNVFRFSSKYFDGKSGLYYYGYRYYSAELGRWINRDLIEEDGGINLYAFVSNRMKIDKLGKKIYVIRRPLTFFTKKWTNYFEEIGFLALKRSGAYLGKVADYYRNETWHCSLIVTCMGGKESINLSEIDKYDTWDFQSTGNVHHPASDWQKGFQSQCYTGRMAIDTIIDDNSKDAELKDWLAFGIKNKQEYVLGGKYRFNCCDWISKLFYRALNIIYKAPNPKPFGVKDTPSWVPSQEIGKLIDKKYMQKTK